MAERLICLPDRVVALKFRQTSSDILNDLLINLDKGNKENLNNLHKCCGSFKQKNLIEYAFMMTEELGLDPLVGYHAVELLQRFMVRRVWDCLATPTAGGAAGDEPASYEDAIFDRLKDNFPLIIFSSVQLANKLFLHSHKIHINAAVLFLRSIGVRASKQTVLESELMVFKGLEFNLNVPNPLTYVEVLLEVLGYNEPDVPIENLYQRCLNVLQFVTLERTAIYEALLRVTTQSVSPSREQREKFVTVTEDCMLLGVGVIAVATFICLFQDWEEVVEELSHITGISMRSIKDFFHVALMHIISSPEEI